MHCTAASRLFRIIIVIYVAFFRQGCDPVGTNIILFVDRDIFFQFFPILQPAFLHWHPPCVKRHSPQAISGGVHVSLFGQPDLAPWNGLAVS